MYLFLRRAGGSCSSCGDGDNGIGLFGDVFAHNWWVGTVTRCGVNRIHYHHCICTRPVMHCTQVYVVSREVCVCVKYV